MKTTRRFKPGNKLYVDVFYLLNGVLVLLSALVLRVDYYLRVLVLVLARRPLDHVLKLRRCWEGDSWVAFAAGGEVTLSIVRGDYLHYEDGYTFDLLCASLGRLFVEFLELHRSGRGREIIGRLDALRLPPFTGALVGF